MKPSLTVLATLFALAAPALADDGPFKGRADAVGRNCRNNIYFDVEAAIVGSKVEGTLLGNTFQRGPVKFSGDATDTSFTASYVFVNASNLKVEIAGTRIDATTFQITTKWNGGGASNCESAGPAKKG